jgi:hypothetical protein
MMMSGSGRTFFSVMKLACLVSVTIISEYHIYGKWNHLGILIEESATLEEGFVPEANAPEFAAVEDAGEERAGAEEVDEAGAAVKVAGAENANPEEPSDEEAAVDEAGV